MVLGGAVQDEPPRMLALGSGSGPLVMVLGGAVQDEPPLLYDGSCGATVPATQPHLSINLAERRNMIKWRLSVSVVDRHCFDADLGPDISFLMAIQIRI